MAHMDRVYRNMTHEFTAYVPEDFLSTGDGTVFLDVEIKRYNANKPVFAFMHMNRQFRFNIPDDKSVRAKLLLGLPVKLTVLASYTEFKLAQILR